MEIAASLTWSSFAAAFAEPNRTTLAKARSWVGVTPA